MDERGVSNKLDSDTVLWEIVIILVLIGANAVFAMTEMAIVSARKVRLERKMQEGDEGARLALQLAEEPTELFSAIQIGITLIGIFTGAFGGTTLAAALTQVLQTVPWLAPYAGPIAFTGVIAIITYLSLILGELVPKRLAVNHPEQLAMALAQPMYRFARLAKPAVYLLSASTEKVIDFLGIRPVSEPAITEEDINTLIEQGTETGEFDKVEQAMVQRVFRLGDRKAGALMTPRTQMTWLDVEESLEENLAIIKTSTHSRFPLARGSLDDFIGIVYSRDILAQRLEEGHELDLAKMARPPLFVPKSTEVFQVLERLKQAGTHEAMVLDEYGGIMGIITLHDILEAIIGDMPLKEEQEDPDIIQRSDGSWLLDGMLDIEEFKQLFDLEELPEEERENYHTLGGFITSHLGYIPKTAEAFVWQQLRFEIVDMDRMRIDKILVQQLPAAAETNNGELS